MILDIPQTQFGSERFLYTPLLVGAAVEWGYDILA
jgi:hypothetical protein